MLSIKGVLQPSLAAIQVGRDIFETLVEAMDAAQAEKKSGADKKAWVMAFIRAWVNESAHKWDDWAFAVMAFIDVAKALYKQFR